MAPVLRKMARRKRIALIAHDDRKTEPYERPVWDGSVARRG